MGRPTSTVSREAGRFGGRHGYTGREAQRQAAERARQPKPQILRSRHYTKFLTVPSHLEQTSNAA
jgi:IS30 family transposase